MAECRISNGLAKFLIELAVDPKFHTEFNDPNKKEAVLTRPEFGLTPDEIDALRNANRAQIRRLLDNVQVQKP